MQEEKNILRSTRAYHHHPVDELNNNHTHMVTTSIDHDKLIIGGRVEQQPHPHGNHLERSQQAHNRHSQK